MIERATVELLSVNSGPPRSIGERHGVAILSGIGKQPVGTPTVFVTLTGLAGDGQGDTVNHGGFDKAVYAYAADHFAAWSREHGREQTYDPGAFGENLTVKGWTERDVYIGDRWRWGDVLLEVCQPRYPCYKLAMVLERPSIVREMVENRRTGWYLRVLQAGEAPSAGEIELEERGLGGSTVMDAHLARLPGADLEVRARVASDHRLASSLRRALIEDNRSKG